MIGHSRLFPGLADLGAAWLNQHFQWLHMRTLFALTRFMRGPVRTEK